jgi:hypothetical protein
MRSTGVRSPLISLLLLGLLAACGTGRATDPAAPAGTAPGGDRPTSSGNLSVKPGSGSKGHPKMVTPRPGEKGVHPIRWQSVKVARGGRALRVHFTSGVAPCAVLDRVGVRSRPATVQVTLYEGRAPGSHDTACIDIAQLKVVAVRLGEPLGGRKVVDGAR